MSLKALERKLQEKVEPVYIVLGEATPLVDRALGLITAQVLPQVAAPAFNHGRFRASEPEAPSAITAARTLPMMGTMRLVEVRNLGEGTAAFFTAFVDYLADPSRDTVFVASGRRFPKVEKGGSNWGARVKAALKKSGRGELLQIGDREMAPAAFAIEAAEALGKTLSRPHAQLLVATIGPDLGRLEQEVSKLASFVGEARAIDASAIEQASALVAEAAVWDLTAGLAARDTAQTLAALHRLQEGGDDARKLLGLITWQMRELLRASELVRSGAADAEVTRAVRLRSDVFRKLKPQLRSGFPAAADMLRRIATANRHMNSHRAGADRLLDGLVLEVLGGALRRPPPVPRPR